MLVGLSGFKSPLGLQFRLLRDSLRIGLIRFQWDLRCSEGFSVSSYGRQEYYMVLIDSPSSQSPLGFEFPTPAVSVPIPPLSMRLAPPLKCQALITHNNHQPCCGHNDRDELAF